jgi:hypothetical protein
MANETNQTQQRRAAEEVVKPLQSKGGNEKMENKQTPNNLEEEVRKHYELGVKALRKRNLVSADKHARRLVELEGESAYASLARGVVWPSDEEAVAYGYRSEWQIVDLVEMCASRLDTGFGGWATPCGGEPNRTNHQFAEALYKEANVLRKMLSQVKY